METNELVAVLPSATDRGGSQKVTTDGLMHC